MKYQVGDRVALADNYGMQCLGEEGRVKRVGSFYGKKSTYTYIVECPKYPKTFLANDKHLWRII